MSLPEFGGMDAGFNYYYGADPSEYDLVLSNSEGGLERLRELGRPPRRGGLLGRRPRALPAASRWRRRRTSSSTATATSSASEWMEAMIGEPSRRLPDVDFALGGERLPWRHRPRAGRRRRALQRLRPGDLGARINLNVTRRAHATVYASSTCRPFELAMSGATIVSNPHDGIERWFEPGRELLVVENADGAVAAYQELLDDPGRAEELGRAARERALDEHTYLHRARRLLELLGAGVPEAVRG